MLGIAHIHSKMSDTASADPSIPDEVLEDGEIDDDDDDDEVITEETEVIEETLEPIPATREESGVDVPSQDQFDRFDGRKYETDDQEVSAGDDRKKSHKKHQRKRKKHRDSKERELKAEKKERRRNKRKMHGYDDEAESHEHGDSLSPHSKRRKKRKKHSRDRRDRDSTTPDSEDSMEEYPQSYYGAKNGYTNEYGANSAMYSSNSIYHSNAEQYYSTTTNQPYSKNDSKDYGDDSGSDFEAQLAEYKNYKTHGDSRKEKSQDGNKDEMSAAGGEMYEEFMEYDENPKRPCKFFAEGKCLKGNECPFSHDQLARKEKPKKREICKYYLAGHCHHGNQCSYMHGEYPCKYFHTGVTCYAGDNCRFSHDPANDETQEIIDNFKDVLGNVDDSWEISELSKLGITVKPKPPPGVGLLPTPDIAPMTEQEQSVTPTGAFANSGSAIPSIFDISVAPTAEFQKRINQNNVASLSKSDDRTENRTSQLPPQMYPNPINRKIKNNGAGLLPTPNTMPINLLGSNHGNYYNDYSEPQSSDNQKLVSEGGKTMPAEDVITSGDDFIPVDHSTTENEQAEDATLQVPEFLPATQKALFMRIHGKKVTADQDKVSDAKGAKRDDQDLWTYSSDEDEKPKVHDAGVIKMETDSHVSTSNTVPSSSAVESFLKMISKSGGNPANVDASLLSKVASVINIPNTTADTYSSPGVATYNPAQSKVSPRRSSTTQQRERKNSGSISSSPVNSTRHHQPAPIRRRLSTQELTKEPIVIPLIAKQTGNQSMHSSHPDPRITLSRLISSKPARFMASLPKFSKDLILPNSPQILNMKVTLSSDDSKSSKRDPRLGRQKDPRLQRSIDPRLKARSVLKSSTNNTVPPTAEPKSSSIPSKPSALLTKSSTSIPSLPELDLNLAYVQQVSKENGSNHVTATSKASSTPYSLPTLKLPRLVKAPNVANSPARDSAPDDSLPKEPTIAPYDPRYMSSASSTTTDSTDLPMTTAPYDPRVLTGQSNLTSSGDIKKRTIQLPKLTPAPLFQSGDSHALPTLVRPEGDQGDF